MKATVIRLYDRGARRMRPADPAHGDLSMDSMQVGGYRVYRAFLTDKNGVVVPPLRDAKVTRITERGMVLRGIEQIQERPTPKARVYQYPQVWWVRLQPGQSNVIQLKPSPHPAEVSG